VWHSISQGVREARRTHGLKHLPANTGIPSAEDVPGEELPGEELLGAAEEHIAARSPAPIHRSGTAGTSD
jgi:hypothetical protein